MEPISVIRPGAKFTLVLVNQYGQGLNRDDSRFSRTETAQRPFAAEFDDIEAARAFSESVVQDAAR